MGPLRRQRSPGVLTLKKKPDMKLIVLALTLLAVTFATADPVPSKKRDLEGLRTSIAAILEKIKGKFSSATEHAADTADDILVALKDAYKSVEDSDDVTAVKKIVLDTVAKVEKYFDNNSPDAVKDAIHKLKDTASEVQKGVDDVMDEFIKVIISLTLY